jgi:hypothetical protein
MTPSRIGRILGTLALASVACAGSTRSSREASAPPPATAAAEQSTSAPATPAAEPSTSAPATPAAEPSASAPATPAAEPSTSAPATSAADRSTSAPATSATEQSTSGGAAKATSSAGAAAPGSASQSPAGAASTSASASAGAAGAKEIQGRVEQIDRANHVTIAGSENVGHAFDQFKADQNTRVTVNGKESTLGTVQEGDEVRASFSGSGDALHLDRLEVRSPNE